MRRLVVMGAALAAIALVGLRPSAAPARRVIDSPGAFAPRIAHCQPTHICPFRAAALPPGQTGTYIVYIAPGFIGPPAPNERRATLVPASFIGPLLPGEVRAAIAP